MAAKDMLLMFEDTAVMRINFDENVYSVINTRYLPYGLRGKLRNIQEVRDGATKYEQNKRIADILVNYNAVIDWLSSRTLLLSRANAKWLYNALHIEQKTDKSTGLKIAIMCRDVSVLDKYWVKIDGDPITWNKVDINRNPLNEVIAQIALHGKSLTIQGSLVSPEFTTNGAYAKAWRRHPDGNLWLYKLGHNGNTESRIEVMVSNILDKCNVDHVHYEAGEDEGKYVCMCPCISSDRYSIIPASDYYSYCNVNGLSFDKEILRLGADDWYKMHIVDYLISNRDRHLQNWGFFMDNQTMEVVSLHPLFDHNNAFDVQWMQNKDQDYLCTNKTIRESALFAIKHTDFHFTAPITRDDFITERQYKSFMDRSEELGIKVIPKTESNPFASAINKMG